MARESFSKKKKKEPEEKKPFALLQIFFLSHLFSRYYYISLKFRKYKTIKRQNKSCHKPKYSSGRKSAKLRVCFSLINGQNKFLWIYNTILSRYCITPNISFLFTEKRIELTVFIVVHLTHKIPYFNVDSIVRKAKIRKKTVKRTTNDRR